MMLLHGLTIAGLWVWIAVQDLSCREVYSVGLWAVTILCLAGHPWYWWVLVVVTLAWPWQRRGALALSPLAIAVGTVAGEGGMPSALALATGTAAWALGWWEAGDVAVLLALGLRYGLAGLVVGTVVLALAGGALMVVRKRSLWRLPAIVMGVVVERRLPSLLEEGDGTIPDEAEMPAAAVLAVCGLVMEGVLMIA